MNLTGVPLSTLVRLKRELPTPEECHRIRLAAQVSSEAVGTEVGVTGQTIRLWERGRRRPTGDHLARYIAALDIMRAGDR